MTVTVAGTSVTFNDSTSQATAFVGARATAYTTAGTSTFTIPSGVTALKITVVGGGGSSSYTVYGPCCSSTTYAGVAGGTSSVSSGTQTISTISATGGAGQGITVGTFDGGIGAGGVLNGKGGNGFRVGGLSGYSSATGSSIFSFVNGTGVLGAAGGLGGGGGHAIGFLTGLTPGLTLSVTRGAGGAVGTAVSGGDGVVLIEW